MENKKFKQYMFFESIKYIKKLKLDNKKLKTNKFKLENKKCI